MSTTDEPAEAQTIYSDMLKKFEELQRCLNHGWTRRGRELIYQLKQDLAELVGRAA